MRGKGRPIDLEAVKNVAKYRKLGLRVIDIARIMKKDPAQILRWYSYIDNNKVKV